MIKQVSTFKERFNEALNIRNMKPIELCEKTGISESTISQYRSGYAKPKENKLMVISNALDVNPVWLMGLDVPMEYVQTFPYDENSAKISEAMRMYSAYVKADPKIQGMIEQLLELSQSMPQIPQLDVSKLPKLKPELPRLKKDSDK